MDREVGKTTAEDADEDGNDDPGEDDGETAPTVGQSVLGGWLCRRPLRMSGPVRVGGMVVVVFFVHNDKIKPAPMKKKSLCAHTAALRCRGWFNLYPQK